MEEHHKAAYPNSDMPEYTHKSGVKFVDRSQIRWNLPGFRQCALKMLKKPGKLLIWAPRFSSFDLNTPGPRFPSVKWE